MTPYTYLLVVASPTADNGFLYYDNVSCKMEWRMDASRATWFDSKKQAEETYYKLFPSAKTCLTWQFSCAKSSKA